MFKKMVKALTSLKLTIAILGVMIILSIPSTLIQQHQPMEFYLSAYPGSLGNFILAFGYNHFFSSPLFITVICIFWINLFSCTVKRFVGQLKRKRKGMFGPDILHMGLLILIIGATISFSTRQEGTLYLAPGDAMVLPSDRYMVLDDFIFELYPDGRPKSWISEVTITEERNSLGEKYPIAVNNPLRIDGLVIYQATYRPSEKVGVYETGLLVTSDPGKIYILISFIIITMGLILTFIQKRRTLS